MPAATLPTQSLRRSARRHQPYERASRCTQPQTLMPTPIRRARQVLARVSTSRTTRSLSPSPPLHSPFTSFIRGIGVNHPILDAPDVQRGNMDPIALQARVAELEEENADLMASNVLSQRSLRNVSQAVSEAVVMIIFLFIYPDAAPSLDTCGHHRCLACLLRVFKGQLAHKLREEFDGNPPVYMLFGVSLLPRTIAERNLIWREVRFSLREEYMKAGASPALADSTAVDEATRMFTYTCPTCGRSVEKVPVEADHGRPICKAYRDHILDDIDVMVQPNEAEQVPLVDFIPLFMNAQAIRQELLTSPRLT
ncbi:hypothetical protein ONZ45_g7568 [Pleurotus djamor]|nr:hypothetical protein ONZ45_g7568 [Pleurotus djamor]